MAVGVLAETCTEEEAKVYESIETKILSECEASSDLCTRDECEELMNKVKFIPQLDCTTSDGIQDSIQSFVAEYEEKCYTPCTAEEAEAFYTEYNPVGLKEKAASCKEKVAASGKKTSVVVVVPDMCSIQDCIDIIQTYRSITFPDCAWNLVHFKKDLEPSTTQSIEQWDNACKNLSF